MKTRLTRSKSRRRASAKSRRALLVAKRISAGVLSVLLLASGGMLPFSTVAIAAPATTLFNDGFESGDFSGWDSPVSSNWEVNFGSISGIFGADVEGDTDGDDWLVRSISTEGYENLVLAYSFKADDLDTVGHADNVAVEYTANGTSWTEVYAIKDGEDDHIPGTEVGIYHKSHPLPSDAANNPNFAFRFNANLIGGPDEVWIDDVSLSGEAIGAEDTGTTTATSTPPLVEEESLFEHCDDGIDNDGDGFTDVFDLGCLEFRQTATVFTEVSGGLATSSDFLMDLLFGTTTLSSSIQGGASGVDLTSPFSGTWRVVQHPADGYTALFSEDCDVNGFITMTFNVHKNCRIMNTFSATTSAETGTTTDTTPPADTDSDGIADESDNCPFAANPDQADTDQDGEGDVCDDTPLPPQSASESSEDSSGSQSGSVPPSCADGSDNDNDGFADMNDPGCSDSLDNDESTVPGGTGQAVLPSLPTEGEVLGAATTTPQFSATTTALSLRCTEYLHEHLKPGNNSPGEVKKLQMFLNEFLDAELPINGRYGPSTVQWVKKFQLKYHKQVLQPWIDVGYNGIEVREGSGVVYKTTLRQINMLKCPELQLPMPDLKPDLE